MCIVFDTVISIVWLARQSENKIALSFIQSVYFFYFLLHLVFSFFLLLKKEIWKDPPPPSHPLDLAKQESHV